MGKGILSPPITTTPPPPKFFNLPASLKGLLMSSSDSFKHFETTIFFRKTEFVYLFLCTNNLNNNTQFFGKNSSQKLVNFVVSQSIIWYVQFSSLSPKTFFEMSNVVCGTVIPIFGQPYDTSQSNPQVSPGKFGKKNKRSLYILISVWLWNFKDGGS